MRCGAIVHRRVKLAEVEAGGRRRRRSLRGVSREHERWGRANVQSTIKLSVCGHDARSDTTASSIGVFRSANRCVQIPVSWTRCAYMRVFC